MSARPRRITDRYEVLDLLASGGMADVYLARDVQLDRRVAVKVLRNVAESARFRAEAQTLARLSHPALVGVLDVGDLEGRPFLVLELVEGTTLADCCLGTALPAARVAHVGRQMAGALAYVHESGIVHRDVKPANILLADDGRVLLADFGIARLLEGHVGMTETGTTLGTAAYLAPEQVSGAPITRAVDVYALGLVLLEALTGVRAFPGAPGEAAVARLHRSPEVPATLTPGWRELLTTMTALEPEDRPDAREVERRLASLDGPVDEAGLTRPLTVPLVLPESPAKRPAPLADRARSELERLREARHRLPGLPAVPVLAAVVAAVALLLLLLVLLTSRGDGAAPAPTTPRSVPSGIPSGVPSGLVDELQQLHEAVQGR